MSSEGKRAAKLQCSAEQESGRGQRCEEKPRRVCGHQRNPFQEGRKAAVLGPQGSSGQGGALTAGDGGVADPWRRISGQKPAHHGVNGGQEVALEYVQVIFE